MKKLLYIHGWGFNNYTSNGTKYTCFDRPKLIDALSKHYEVRILKLPGFFGKPDPDRPWELADFVEYLDKNVKSEKVDLILGYSFGGAVSLRWKKINPESSVKVILVSPAIVRNYRKTGFKFIQNKLKNLLPENFRIKLSDLYLKYIIRNPFYANASPIMRQTYRNIVKIDLRQDLLNIKEAMTIIYGEYDTATPPTLVEDIINKKSLKHNISIIPKGTHDIGRTHIEEVVSNILKYNK